MDYSKQVWPYSFGLLDASGVDFMHIKQINIISGEPVMQARQVARNCTREPGPCFTADLSTADSWFTAV